MKRLETVSQWQALLEESKTRPVVLMKHSNTCGTSARMFAALVGAEKEGGNELNVVVVQTARDVSDGIAADLGVIHESPQAFVIKDGAAMYEADHGEINVEEITKIALAQG